MNHIIIPEKSLVASFDVDAQNTFTPVCPAELPVPEGTAIVSQLNKQAKFSCVRVGSKDAHSPEAKWIADETHPQLSPIEGDNMDVYWKPHGIPGTLGFDLIQGLPEITQYDFFVWKGIELDMHPYGACYHDFDEKLSTGVLEFLHSKGIKTVIVGGLATEFCVKNTVLQLVGAGMQVVLNLSACRGLAHDTTQLALKEMREAGVTLLESTAQLQQVIR